MAQFNLGSDFKEVHSSAPASMKIEVEAKDFSEVEDVLSGKPDMIMLGNMRVSEVKRTVEFVRKSGCGALLEVSGGITIENVWEYAETGVDIISVGELTHSVKSLDISMDLKPGT